MKMSWTKKISHGWGRRRHNTWRRDTPLPGMQASRPYPALLSLPLRGGHRASTNGHARRIGFSMPQPPRLV